MQVHTPADQLLSPLDGETDREREGETWRRCEITLPAHLHTEPQRGLCPLCSALPTLPLTDTTCVCPGPSEKARQQGRSSIRGESSVIHLAVVSQETCTCQMVILCGVDTQNLTMRHNAESKKKTVHGCAVYVIEGY